jgi:hypothetical protein
MAALYERPRVLRINGNRNQDLDLLTYEVKLPVQSGPQKKMPGFSPGHFCFLDFFILGIDLFQH